MAARSLGYAQSASLSAARSLATIFGGTVPAASDFCVVQCEAQPCRWRADGTDPTATVGNLLAAGDTLVVGRAWYARFRIVETAASAKVSVDFQKTG